ncbi:MULTISPECIES: ABC transporter substrate-binding protein [Limnochorda]|uniref:ABC transporter substrate-binding protein n=1 Tax=Limnochorda TaxID=1676651 RepID=UPI00178FCDA1|nr:ABC transporter substrate-binding protein [Limnochorda pilosa]MBO2487022.1 ABC transporter substrate-binding protein [Bacillota bacterium]MBO2518445.1 ABC transporter substrate-binding protein [Bacillota bacterium]NMA71666.1 ABC transporter substrate-binding protein [Bacillota bacterium]
MTLLSVIACLVCLVPATAVAQPAIEWPDLTGVTLTVAAGAVGQELQLTKEAAAAFSELTGARVEVLETPDLATDRLGLYLQYLGARSPDIDVYQVDVIWPGILAEHAVDLFQYVPEEEIAQHFPATIANNTIDGRLVALPWFTDAGLLYYRADLLEKYGFSGPPATWEDLTEMARVIQEGERAAGNPSFWGFVWQGNRYEGLTCDALEWQVSFGGGTIIEPDGTISVNNPRTVEALKMARSWVGTISPPGVTTYAEEEARAIFQSGNAAFMRNWPYAYALAQAEDSPVRGKVGVAPLPSGGAGSAAALGGWSLMVSRYSRNQEAAAWLVRYLASYEEQKRRAIEGSFNPTIEALYDDADVLAASPFMGQLYDVFINAVPRPSAVAGERYNEVSTAYFTAVHQVLTGQVTAEQALTRLEAELRRIMR